MRITLHLLSLGALIWIAGCGSTAKIKEHNYHLKLAPPNGVEIRPGFYADRTEITNFNWMEYLFWIKKVYGKDSDIFQAALPDTSVWLQAGSCLDPYRTHYLRHPAYRYFPVVGISQQQARDYSAWRSDRVFEFLLIRFGKITWDEHPSPLTHFTITRYFNDSIRGLLPGDKLAYYPEFRLPDPEESLELHAYAGKYDKPGYQAKLVIPCIDGALNHEPVSRVSSSKRRSEKNAIYQVRDNVSEWTNAPALAAGENWHRIFETDTFTVSEPNAWTGFRNVCEWKKWEK